MATPVNIGGKVQKRIHQIRKDWRIASLETARFATPPSKKKIPVMISHTVNPITKLPTRGRCSKSSKSVALQNGNFTTRVYFSLASTRNA